MTPFVLYARATISYEGRARSVLESGCYLIVSKLDGSFMVHGATKVTPRNYQRPGSFLVIGDGWMVCHYRKETMTVYIEKELFRQELPDWSCSEIVLEKTEKELVNKIAAQPYQYFGFVPEQIFLEFPTPVGPVDLVAVHQGKLYPVEVKRNKVTLNNCHQLRKYVEYLHQAHTIGKASMAGPEIAANALAHCKTVGYGWMQVQFD